MNNKNTMLNNNCSFKRLSRKLNQLGYVLRIESWLRKAIRQFFQYFTLFNGVSCLYLEDKLDVKITAYKH